MGNLTVKGVESIIKKGEPGKTGDGNGLYLQISKSGVPSWIYRYKSDGKSREMGLGRYPNVTLADARGIASDQRKIRLSGADPLEARNDERQARKAAAQASADKPSFKELATKLHLIRTYGMSEKWTKGWIRKLELYVFDFIGDMKADQVRTADVVRVLEPIWLVKNRTADEVRLQIESVLEYAKTHEYRTGDNPARWVNHLENVLSVAARDKARTKKNYPSMDWRNVPKLIADLKHTKSRDADAARLLIYSCARTKMVRFAEWQDIDIVNEVWTVPAHKMKMMEEFKIPLPPIVIDLLKSLPRYKDQTYLFPGSGRSGAMGANAIRTLLHKMGHTDVTRHGFRSSGRNWAAEQTNYPREICEMMLAHDERSKTEKSYNHTDYLDKRMILLTDWTEYLSSHESQLI